MRKILLSLRLCAYSLPSQRGVLIFTANSEWQRWLHPPQNVCQWADLKISSTKASKNPQNLRSERKLLPTLKKHKKDFPILLLVDVKIMRPSAHHHIKSGTEKYAFSFFHGVSGMLEWDFFLLFTWWSIDLCFRFSSSTSTCFSHAVGSDGWNVFPVMGDIVFFLYLCSHFLAAFYPRLVQQCDEKIK